MHVKLFIVVYWHLHHFPNAWTARPKRCWKGEHEGDNCWEPGASCTLHNQIVKFKSMLCFSWGGWSCIGGLHTAVVQITEVVGVFRVFCNNEKEKLVAFVNPVFTNYNKSKEQLHSQAMKEYCKLSIGHSFSHCLFDHNTASLKTKLMFTSTKEHHKIHRKIFRFYSRHSRRMCQAATCIVWTHRQWYRSYDVTPRHKTKYELPEVRSKTLLQYGYISRYYWNHKW